MPHVRPARRVPLCVEKGWVITELHAIETRLEDVFRDLTIN
jgi:hypothetical protein